MTYLEVGKNSVSKKTDRRPLDLFCTEDGFNLGMH